MSSLANPASGSNPSLDQVAAQVSRYKRFFAIAIVLWFAVAVTPHWIPTSDGALYLMLGRSVAHGEGYTLFGKPHTFVPPGYPLMIASLERIGLGSMLCLNIAMAILGLLTVWLSYRLVSLLASRQVAWLVAVLVGLNATVHTLSARQLSDIPFTVLVLAGMVCLLEGLRGRRWMLEIGTLAIVASCWIRLTGLALAVGCVAGMILERRHVSRLRLAGNALAVVAVLAASAGMFNARYLNCLKTANSPPPMSYVGTIAPELANSTQFWIWGPIENARRSASELSRYLDGQELWPIISLFVLVVPVFVGLGRRMLRGEFLVGVAAIAYFCGIILILPAMDRYMLPFAPILVLFFLEGVAVLIPSRANWKPFATRALLAVVVVLILFNGAKGIGGIRRNRDMVAQRGAELDSLVKWIKTEVQPGEQFLGSERERELAYLSGIPWFQFDRAALMKRMKPAEYLKLLFDHRARLWVVAPEKPSSTPDTPLLLTAVDDNRMFHLVGQIGRYRVFRYVAPPAEQPLSAATKQADRRF